MAVDENEPAKTIAAGLADVFVRAGVKVAFTVPGESVLAIIDALAARQVRIVAARHESSAAFMAEAGAQLTSRPGLVIATRGPGAANLAVGLETAMADSTPLVALVGQVRRDVKGKEAFQEIDVVRAFEPLVKWAGEAREPGDVIPLAERAIATALHGRPGPVLLAVPEDLLEWKTTDGQAAIPHASGRPEIHAEAHTMPDPILVRKVLHLLVDSERPLILAGGGVLRARCSDALVKFAETLQVPIVSSWRRPDVFPNDNTLYLGMAGPGGQPSVRRRLEEADGLLVLGCRLGEPTSYGYAIPAASTRWAQVDVEPRGGGSGHRPELIMVSDSAAFLRVARRVLEGAALEASSFDARKEAIARYRAEFEADTVLEREPWDGPGVHPGRVIAALSRLLPPDAVLTTDAGDFSNWAVRGFLFHRPGTFVGPTSGAMGYGLPAAIGCSVARPGRLAVALAGDGGFAMTMADLETAVRERAHVLALVFDNGRYGMIWRHQAARGERAGLATELGKVDFAEVANSCGALGITVASDDEFEPALRRALEAGRPAVLHLSLDPFWTTPDAMWGAEGLAEPAGVESNGREEQGESAEAAPTDLEPEPEPEPEPVDDEALVDPSVPSA